MVIGEETSYSLKGIASYILVLVSLFLLYYFFFTQGQDCSLGENLYRSGHLARSIMKKLGVDPSLSTLMWVELMRTTKRIKRMGMSMIHSRRFPQSGSVFGDASKLKIRSHIYIKKIVFLPQIQACSDNCIKVIFIDLLEYISITKVCF